MNLLITPLIDHKEAYLDSLYLTNPPLAKQYLIDYYKSLDEDWVEQASIKEALVNGDCSMTLSIKKKIFFKGFLKKHGKYFCQICGDDLPERDNGKGRAKTATIEHFIPIGEGGLKYALSNFICTCYKCNCERGIKPLYPVKGNNLMFYYK